MYPDRAPQVPVDQTLGHPIFAGEGKKHPKVLQNRIYLNHPPKNPRKRTPVDGKPKKKMKKKLCQRLLPAVRLLTRSLMGLWAVIGLVGPQASGSWTARPGASTFGRPTARTRARGAVSSPSTEWQSQGYPLCNADEHQASGLSFHAWRESRGEGSRGGECAFRGGRSMMCRLEFFILAPPAPTFARQGCVRALCPCAARPRGISGT